NLVALYLCLTRLADQLVYGRHITIPCKIFFQTLAGQSDAVTGGDKRELPHAQNVAYRFYRWTTKSRGRIPHASCVQHSCLQRASGTLFETYSRTSRSRRTGLTSLPMVRRLLFYPLAVKARAEN